MTALCCRVGDWLSRRGDRGSCQWASRVHIGVERADDIVPREPLEMMRLQAEVQGREAGPVVRNKKPVRRAPP